MAMKIATALLLTGALALMATAGFASEERDVVGQTPYGTAAGPNDQCAGAIPLAGAFDFTTDTCDDTNDYDPLAGNSCTGFSAAGLDETYSVCLPPGGTIDLTFDEIDYDASIYLVTDCGNIVGTCVAGDDCFPEPCTDFITYTNTGIDAANYWLIVDGFGTSNCGHGQLTGVTDVCNATAVETATWGAIKALHR